MVQSKTEITELEPETFEVMECLDASINIDLFSETIISVVGDKHHRHPVIAGVIRNLFRATTTYNIHNFCVSCRTFEGQVHTCRVRQKTNMV